MKTIYLILIFILSLYSCSPVSHVPSMPNAPMFDGAFEGKIQGAAGLDHYEIQGAVSPIRHLGVIGNYYVGSRGIKQFEYGINGYSPFTKDGQTFISATLGKGKGSFKGKYTTYSFSDATIKYRINNDFDTKYFQLDIYRVFNRSNNLKLKLGIAFKYEQVNFENFNIKYEKRVPSSIGSHTVESYKNGGVAIIQTPFLNFLIESKKAPVMVNLQVGHRFVTKGFQPEIINFSGVQSVPSGIELINTGINPYFNPTMINISIGYKF